MVTDMTAIGTLSISLYGIGHILYKPKSGSSTISKTLILGNTLIRDAPLKDK